LWKHNAIAFEDIAFQGIYKNNLGAEWESRLVLEAVAITAGFKKAYAVDEAVYDKPYQAEKVAEWAARRL
jgi:hypothetical protein